MEKKCSNCWHMLKNGECLNESDEFMEFYEMLEKIQNSVENKTGEKWEPSEKLMADLCPDYSYYYFDITKYNNR